MNGKFDLFFALLTKMPGVTKDDIVRQYSGGESLSELHERAPKVYKRMIEDMRKATAGEDDDQRADRMRKRVIASVAGYFDKVGLYIGIPRRERMQKIISTACLAAGVDDFNAMTEAQMRRVYNEFLRMQKVAEKAGKICEDIKEEGERKVIKRGCLSVVLPK